MNVLSIKELKEKEKENRVNYVIDAAEKLFFTNNYDDVSMNDIAEKVGVSRTALYRYFKNKESIYFAIVLRAARIMNKMFENGVKSKKNGLNKLRDLGNAYYEFYKDFPDYYNIYLSFEYLRFQNNEKYDISEILAINFNLIKIMCETIVEGMQDNSIRKDLNPLEIAMFIATTSNSILKTNPNTLHALGINEKQYFEDYLCLWDRMLTNSEK